MGKARRPCQSPSSSGGDKSIFFGTVPVLSQFFPRRDRFGQNLLIRLIASLEPGGFDKATGMFGKILGSIPLRSFGWFGALF